MSYALGRPLLLNLEAFAQVTQVHPDLVTHFVTLGLLEPVRTPPAASGSTRRNAPNSRASSGCAPPSP